MSTRAWLLMVVILALNWGGFAVTLVYGLRREARRARGTPGSDDRV